MTDVSGYDFGDGAIASYDQLKASALEQLRTADSFLCMLGNVDNSMRSGMRIMVISATKTPFAPYFLAEAVNAGASVVVQSIEALGEEEDAASA